MSTDKRFSRSERALMVVGVLFPGLVLAGVAVNARLNDLPPQVLPSQARQELPVPNAHDTLRAAKVLLVLKKGTVELAPRDLDVVQPLEERKALLAANGPALAQLREALAQEYRQPMSYSVNQLFPEYAEHRELARLLVFAARTHADSGNLDEAVRCATDAIALGIKIPRGGPLIGLLVGIACEALGRGALAELAENLDRPTLKRTLERLDALESTRWTLAQTLEAEHIGSQMTIYDMAGQSPTELARSFGFMGESSGNTQNSALMWRLAFTSKRLALENNNRHFAKLIATVKQPYRQGAVVQPEPTDAINELLLPAFSQAHFSDARNRTEANLLRARLALLLNGKPDTRFTDPLGQDQPLRFRQDGEHFVLYSVGPDGDDDGGRPGVPRERFAAQKERGRTLGVADEGDLVARVNTL